MVIKNWYSSGKSIESHDWMVICSIGTWEKHFYFCFIVFLSICLMQVLICTLLTIKVSMLKRKKKVFFLFLLQKKLYVPFIFLWKHLGHCPLYGLLALLFVHATVSRCFLDACLKTQTPDLTFTLHSSYCHALIWLDLSPSQETEFWESLNWDRYLLYGSSLSFGMPPFLNWAITQIWFEWNSWYNFRR